MLTGNSNEEKIWNYLIGYGLTQEGAAGLMGNIIAESNCKPNNLQNTGNTKLGMTDEEFTAAMDNGSYTNFIHDGFGYGLVQWTFWSLKQSLYDYWKSRGGSIGDLAMQLDFLMFQLSRDFPGIMNVLKTTHDVRTATEEVLMKFERPASVSDPTSERCQQTKDQRTGYSMEIYQKYSKKGDNMPKYTNSSLASVKLISPNRTSPRNHSIDRITIHCFVGQVTAQRGCEIFQPTSFQASCNYMVGKNGDIGICVEEKDRSWCTSSKENDHRAITIETASDKVAPYWVTDAAFNALLDLCTDICRRNGKNKIIWFGDKTKTLNYIPEPNEMIMTVHRWFKNKDCPGQYLYDLHPTIANEVNRRLNGETPMQINPSQGTTSSKPSTPQPSQPSGQMYRVRKSWADVASQVGAYTVLDNAKAECDKHPGYSVYDSNGNAVYPVEAFKPYVVEVTISDLNIRKGPGTNYAKTGKYTGKGKFTIVAEQNGWGKLKSGAGWISLAYTHRV